MVASGAVGPVSEPRAEAERQLLLRAHNICSLANNFAAFGFYPVLDYVVPNRQVLDLMVGLLRPRPVLFVTLAPTLQVAAARNEARPTTEQVHGPFAALRQEMADELSSVGWWFDTSALTPSGQEPPSRRRHRPALSSPADGALQAVPFQSEAAQSAVVSELAGGPAPDWTTRRGNGTCPTSSRC